MNAYPPIQAINEPCQLDGRNCPLDCSCHERRQLRAVILNPRSAYNAPRRIIAFTGLAGSGKSTAAAHLVDQGWQRVRFAGPLKAMMAALGLTDREIEGDLKEQPCALLSDKTPRFAMQTIGTEWGRDTIATDLWLRAWQAGLDRVPAGVNVVVDDCRFPNEAEAVRAAGGIIVRIVRPNCGQGAAGHSSECQVIETGPEIVNSGSVTQLHIAIDDLVAPIQ